MIDVLAGWLSGFSLWQATAVVLGFSIAAAVGVELVAVKLIRRAVRRTESRFDDILLSELRLPIVVTVFLAGVYVITSTPAAEATVLGRDGLERFFGRPSLSIAILAWAWALNQIVNRSVDEVADGGRQYDFAPVFSNVWTLAVLVTAGALLLYVWELEVTPLLGAAGVAGIAVGFAAKDTVANFFGGLALYFDDTYKIGDFVTLESGDAGTVVKIGVRSTTILTRAETLVTVPNATLNAGKVVNQSAPQPRKRVTVPVGVAYGTDLDALEGLLLEIADEEPLVLETPTPRARFRRFGDSALEYELLCWVSSPTREGKATHALNRALHAGLAEAGIEVPYPKRDVTMRPVDESPPPDPAAVGADEVDPVADGTGASDPPPDAGLPSGTDPE